MEKKDPTWEQIAQGCNEWMRRYIEEPERFENELSSVQRYLADVEGNREPSYGQTCVAYLRELIK